MMTEQQYNDFLILYPLISYAVLCKKTSIDYLQAFREAAKGVVAKPDSAMIDENITLLDIIRHTFILGGHSLEKCEGVNDTLSFIRELATITANELTEFHNYTTSKGYSGEYVELLNNLENLKHRR